MRTLTSGTLTVQAYDEAVWKQERNVLRVTDTNATVAALYSPTLSTKLAEYTLDENHSVEIDMTDYIRAHSDTYVRNVYISTSPTQTVNASYFVRGLINPEHVLMPNSDIKDFPVALPRCMFCGIFGLSIVPEYLCMSALKTTFAMIIPGDITLQNATKSVPATVEIPTDVKLVTITQSPGNTTIAEYVIKQPEACKRYAAVRWVSFTGQTRLHTWEVTKAKTATRDAIELLTIDGSYHTLKGREDGFVLRLDGLNAYDMWYYADIITSSKVEVSMDGYTWQRVYITTKDITIPDGNAGKLNKLEVNCNWRKYDAITL